jgi:hypothetical protein
LTARTITRSADADAAAAFEAWKAEQNAQGAHLSGAWDGADANGVANAFRYVFDRADAAFTGVVTIGFAVDNPEGITIIAEEYNPNAQLAIGNIGNWQHFHIGNTFILPFLPKLAYSPLARVVVESFADKGEKG